MTGALTTLGCLAREHDRSLVVVATGGELAVGLRDSLDRARVVVKDARPEEAVAAATSCRPWPWMLVGSVPELPTGLAPVLACRPIVVLWLGPSPSELPVHRRCFTRYSELAAAALQALDGEVAGMRLAVGAGVEFPDGRVARGAELEALVSAHPCGFALPSSAFRSATRTLAGRGVALRPLSDPETGRVTLR